MSFHVSLSLPQGQLRKPWVAPSTKSANLTTRSVNQFHYNDHHIRCGLIGTLSLMLVVGHPFIGLWAGYLRITAV